VGSSYTASDPSYQSFEVVYTFKSENEFTIVSEDAELDATFVLVSQDGNTYNMVDVDDESVDLVMVIDDVHIYITVNQSNPWGEYGLYFIECDITEPEGSNQW
jgi:hypothetical protein